MSATSVLYLITQYQWRRRHAVSVRWHTVTFAASQLSENAFPPLLAKQSFMTNHVMSRLDYGNAMLYGLPETQLRKLQMIQNSAARLITGTRRRDHVTPILFRLHWLPVRQRMELNFFYLCFALCIIYAQCIRRR